MTIDKSITHKENQNLKINHKGLDRSCNIKMPHKYKGLCPELCENVRHGGTCLQPQHQIGRGKQTLKAHWLAGVTYWQASGHEETLLQMTQTVLLRMTPKIFLLSHMHTRSCVLAHTYTHAHMCKKIKNNQRMEK